MQKSAFPGDFGVQRAANGGSDPSWLNLAFLGRPTFPSRGPQIPIFNGFWDLWTEKWGAPKNAKFNHDGSDPPFLDGSNSALVIGF